MNNDGLPIAEIMTSIGGITAVSIGDGLIVARFPARPIKRTIVRGNVTFGISAGRVHPVTVIPPYFSVPNSSRAVPAGHVNLIVAALSDALHDYHAANPQYFATADRAADAVRLADEKATRTAELETAIDRQERRLSRLLALASATQAKLDDLRFDLAEVSK